MSLRQPLVLFAVVITLLECGCATQPHTGNLSEKEVVALVSHLTYGMPEEDAVRILEQNGLRKVAADGDSFGWGDGFDGPDNNVSLELEIRPHPLGRNGEWTNGHVEGVYLTRPSGKQVRIPLKGAPKN